MQNYINFNGVNIEFTPEQLAKIRESLAETQDGIRLAEVPAGETFEIGERTMIVLEHLDDGSTVAIYKDFICDDEKFGESNNYNGSNVDNICSAEAKELAAIVGEENLMEFELDLTSDDGLDDYGTVTRKSALLTTQMYRRYVRILDKYKPEKWWWLATAYSTTTHDDADWIKCVSPFGNVDYGIYVRCLGVRPFCILKSDIFVS